MSGVVSGEYWYSTLLFLVWKWNEDFYDWSGGLCCSVWAEFVHSTLVNFTCDSWSMSLSSNRSTGSGSSDDFVVHTAHHTPLGRSELETTFLHPNCDCGSAKDTKNVLMCTEYGEKYFLSYCCVLLCLFFSYPWGLNISLAKSLLSCRFTFTPEREYRNKSPLGQRRKTDSSTATPNGDVTCALDKLLVDECDAVDDKVSTLKESASLQNKKQSKRLLFRPLQQEKKQSHEKKQNQQKQSQQKQPQQKNLPPFHPPLPPPSRVQNQQHHLHHPDEVNGNIMHTHTHSYTHTHTYIRTTKKSSYYG